MTQQQLAQLTQLPAANISHYESGKRVPHRRNAIKLARALGTTLDALFHSELVETPQCEQLLVCFELMDLTQRKLLIAIARCMCETYADSALETGPSTPQACGTSSSVPGGPR